MSFDVSNTEGKFSLHCLPCRNASARAFRARNNACPCKELGISRALWAIPAAYAIATAANIFFTSQNMLRAGTYVSYTVEIVSFAFLVIVIWRYHGFKKENDNGIDFI